MTCESSERDPSSTRGRADRRWRWPAALALSAASCGQPADPQTDTTGTASSGEPTTTATTETTDDPGSTAPTSAGPTTTASTTSSDSTSGDPTSAATGDDSSTGPVACAKNVVLMGYWPPTNEMLRPWSTDPTQNPDGWIGADFGGYGYDVYSFFPEFPPDGEDLLPVLTGKARARHRKLYWRFAQRGQAAVRDGDWKYLKIDNEEQLFHVATDPRERVNLRRREATVFERLKADWGKWNSDMLSPPNGG